MVDINSLDPGIRRVVAFLRERGFETTDSGDGVTKPAAGDTEALTEPHVFMVANWSSLINEANRLLLVLDEHGVDTSDLVVEASYDPRNQVGVVALVGLNDAMLAAAKSHKKGEAYHG